MLVGHHLENVSLCYPTLASDPQDHQDHLTHDERILATIWEIFVISKVAWTLKGVPIASDTLQQFF
jgi:hypothetical protein